MKIITIIHNQFSFLFEDDSLLLPIDGIIQSEFRNPTENEIRADWGLPPIEEQGNVIQILPLKRMLTKQNPRIQHRMRK